MLRMDMLLNPGTPPSSPVRVGVDNQIDLQNNHELDAKNPRENLFSDSRLEAHARGQHLYDAPESPDSPSTVPAVKRLKCELPALRLLLGGAVDNQREEEPHEIFSGQAFWGQVPSLNPSTSPSDVSQVALLSTKRTVVKSPPASFARELVAAPLPSDLLPMLAPAPAGVDVEQSALENEEEVSSPVGVETPSSELKNLARVRTVSTTSGKKKKITICKEDGCTSQALSKQLCMKHGGGPRCSVPNCNNGAKLRNLCFQHGGSTICLADGCSSKAKRFGYCWSHGGGRICREEDCNKVAAQGGMCWAHGGGNRCKLPGCTKRSYKQHGYYCKRHAEVSADY